MGAKYCNECVCLSVRSHISETTWPNFTSFVRFAGGRGSDLIRRCCDVLCTSGFVDDVIFTQSALWRVIAPRGVRGVLVLSKHIWTHIANFGQSCMNIDASSFNMCIKMNSVYWAFHI